MALSPGSLAPGCIWWTAEKAGAGTGLQQICPSRELQLWEGAPGATALLCWGKPGGGRALSLVLKEEEESWEGVAPSWEIDSSELGLAPAQEMTHLNLDGQHTHNAPVAWGPSAEAVHL